MTPENKVRILDEGFDAIEKVVKDGSKFASQGYGYIVTKDDGQQYSVDPITETCDCPSVRICKHIRVAKLLKLIMP